MTKLSDEALKSEVIVPSSNIEQPISRDDVNESSKSADEVQEETEIESDGGDVDIPKNRVVGDSEINDNPQVEEEKKEEESDEGELHRNFFDSRMTAVLL
uniref:Uncharacterized protein n=1 Tax=Caenorhabditis tropicalis TaxID=1561998 RepID=A0A1I7TT91_9PELO